jgi:hypothetical protein
MGLEVLVSPSHATVHDQGAWQQGDVCVSIHPTDPS